MKFVLATNNPGKAKEIGGLFEAEELELISLAALSLTFTPAETGVTFEANAVQKATETMSFIREYGHRDMAVLSDDSGLEIDALNGLPGVDSALFLGADTPYEVRNRHILNEMKQVPEAQRSARFLCVMACVWPNGKIITAQGCVNGFISREIRGTGGFGYDPIFYVPEYGKTMAELTQEEKNNISHRGKALRMMLGKLKNENTGYK
jgi:XTP/dITP diphosphohydrolase